MKLESMEMIKKRISEHYGISNANFSNDKKYLILEHRSAKSPLKYTLYYKGKKLRIVKDNEQLATKVAHYNIPKKTFSTIKVNGNELNMWMMKPVDFDPKQNLSTLDVSILRSRISKCS